MAGFELEDRILRLLFRLLTGLVGTLLSLALLVVLGIGVLAALEVRVPLDTLKEPVEKAAQKALGRELHFDGELVLVPTLWPTLEIGGVSIENPPGWKEREFAHAGSARLQLGLTPLMRREIQVADVTARNVALNLESDAQGNPNWHFGAGAKDETVEPDADAPAADAEPVRFTALHNLTLKDVALSYRDRQLDKTLTLHLERLQGAMSETDPLRLEIAGSFQERPFKLQLTAGTLAGLVDKSATWPLRLQGDLAGAPLTAEGELIRDDGPEIKGAVTLGKLNIGAVLAWLGVSQHIDARAEAVSVRTHWRGDSLAELLARSEAELKLEKGIWTITHPSGKQMVLELSAGTIEIKPERPLAVTLDTRIDRVPLAVSLTASPLQELIRYDAPIPLKLDIEGGGATVALSTTLVRPVRGKGLHFDLRMSGERLDQMNELARADLPPLGPYSLAGKLSLSQRGYAVDGLDLRIGNSHLGGSLGIDIAAAPPAVNLDLRSKRLQIDDFRSDSWSPTKGSGQTADAPKKSDKTAAASEPTSGELSAPLLSRKTLQSLNAQVAIAVDQVLLGAEELGRGKLEGSLKDGRLALESLDLALPGGDARASFLFHPSDGPTELALTARVEQFDYGMLARRIDPASEVGGRLSLDLDVQASANEIEEILLKGRGHVDFGLWPKQLSADLFELWAVNVLSALLTKMSDKNHSKVNCVVARFELDKGVMNDRIVFADTTKMRIEGSAQVDFNTRAIDVAAKPKPKRPEFFSLAVPVGLSGTFDDFGIDLNPVDLTAKTLGFVTSPLHVPLRRIFTEGEPADGEAACRQVWGAGRDLPLDAASEGEAVEKASPTSEGNAGAEAESEVATTTTTEDSTNGQPDKSGKGGLGSRLRRLGERFKDASEKAPEGEPAIDVLNLE